MVTSVDPLPFMNRVDRMPRVVDGVVVVASVESFCALACCWVSGTTLLFRL